MKHYILIGVAAVSGLLAFFLSHVHMKRLQTFYGQQGAKVRVVAASQSLLGGAEITYNDITLREMMESDLTGRELRVDPKTDPNGAKVRQQLLGFRLLVDVPKGGPILTTYLDYGRSTGSVFAATVPIERRAVTVSVDNVSGVANLIRPNDHIDVMGTFRFPSQTPDQPFEMVTVTMLENVTVLAVDQNYSGSRSGVGRSYSTLTLSVDPKMTELLIFAQEKGKLSCALRNPQDVTPVGDRKEINFKYLYDALDVKTASPSR